MKERIQKVLSRLGVFSRRQVETLILEGRVKVNNENAILGCKVDSEDIIEVDGKKVEIPKKSYTLRVLMYHKKIGEISSTNDPQGRPTIYSSLPIIDNGKWISVGLSLIHI